MNHTPLHITRADHAKLRLLLAAHGNAKTDPASRNLREELDRAAVVDPGALPAGVVTMNASVEFEDLGANEIEEYTVTFPENADVERKRISILAPIGTALIGCRVGDIVDWSTPGGVRQLKIRRVNPPPAGPACPGAAPALFAGFTTRPQNRTAFAAA